MDATSLPTDLIVKGQGRFGTLVIPPGTVTDDAITNIANLSATKLEHQHSIHYDQPAGVAVVSETRNRHTARAAGLIVDLEAIVDTAPTGADRTITINLEKGNVSTGFGTLLTTPLVINNTHTARQVRTASLITTPTYADGDTLRIVVTVAGAAGAQGQGLLVTLTTRERADP